MRVEYTHIEQNLSNTNKTEDVVTKRLSSSLKFFSENWMILKKLCWTLRMAKFLTSLK